MTIGDDFPLFLAAMAAAAFFCRAIGFLAMRFVPMTPRYEAALKATPVSVMAGIVAIAASRGGPPEWCATVVVLIIMKLTRQDVAAAFAGIIVVALMRAYGF